MVKAEVIADSINATTGDRLTTFRIVLPRIILAEFNTHRAVSRNFSSSRAVPLKKMRDRCLKYPFIPVYFGVNQKGMQAQQELTGWRYRLARFTWLVARYPACLMHWLAGDVIGVHKQIANRIIEPWLWAEGIISSTEWKNFFALRCHSDAQPEFRALAEAMRRAYIDSMPQLLRAGEWHLPMLEDMDENWREGIGDRDLDTLKRVSVARCARVSYYLQDGKTSSWSKDVELCDRLSSSGHWSPFEHQAMALPDSDRCGNFIGWFQYRKEFANESNGDYFPDRFALEMSDAQTYFQP